jgi:hypothetical protein
MISLLTGCPGLGLRPKAFETPSLGPGPYKAFDEGRAWVGLSGQGKAGHQGFCPALQNTNYILLGLGPAS